MVHTSSIASLYLETRILVKGFVELEVSIL